MTQFTPSRTAVAPRTGLPFPVIPNTSSSNNERDLVERCKAGEAAAWDKLIKLFEPSVFRFAYSLSHSHDDADDIVAHVFLRLYNNIASFRYESALKSWIFRIVRNTHIDMCIRDGYRKNVSLDTTREPDGELECLRVIIDPQDGPEKRCIDKETASLLNHAIRHLPAYQRDVVQMYYLEGKSYITIAGKAGLSIGTVKSRLNRARTNLKERLTPMRETLMNA